MCGGVCGFFGRGMCVGEGRMVGVGSDERRGQLNTQFVS